MNYTKPTIEQLATLIENHNDDAPLILTRFCDGEWWCMNGINGKNCDGAAMTPQLGRALWAAWWHFIAIQSQPYGINSMPHIHAKTFTMSAGKNIKTLDPWQWQGTNVYDSSWTETAVQSGEICRLLSSIPDAVLVGTDHLESVAKLAGWQFIRCHNENAFLELSDILNALQECWTQRHVILCCGLAAEPLAMHINMQTPWRTILDLGAILDPIGGRCSRRYQRDLAPEQIKAMSDAIIKRKESI